jgi:hypothetical protein
MKRKRISSIPKRKKERFGRVTISKTLIANANFSLQGRKIINQKFPYALKSKVIILFEIKSI